MTGSFPVSPVAQPATSTVGTWPISDIRVSPMSDDDNLQLRPFRTALRRWPFNRFCPGGYRLFLEVGTLKRV